MSFRKKHIFLLVFILLINASHSLFAQVKIGSNPTVISKASILELESNNKGLLLPRIQDTTLINALNPSDGMLIFVVAANNQGNLYVRKTGVWALVETDQNINTTLNNLYSKKSISSIDSSVIVRGGDTAVFKNVILLVNKAKVVTDTTVSRVMISPMVLDSLAKAVGKHPLSDSIVSLINKQVISHNLSTSNPLIIRSGTGVGATLKDIQIGIDTNALGHMVTSSPLNDSLAKAFSKSPVKDTISSIINNKSWGLSGNTGTKSAINFMGTIDTADVSFRSNNIERMRLLGSTGYLGIGTATPHASLHVKGQVIIDSLRSGAATDSLVVVNPSDGHLKLIAQNGVNIYLQKVNYIAASGQLKFITPTVISDVNKLCFYRNGILIGVTVAGLNMVTPEVACEAGDEIKIIQFK